MVLIWFLVVVLLIATVTDLVMTQTAVKQWQQATRDVRRDLRNHKIGEAISEIHGWFLGLFDAVYGSRAFSRRRIVALMLSSFGSLVVISLALGWNETRLADLPDLLNWFAGGGDHTVDLQLIIVMPLFNLVADFASLAETRWLLRSSQGKPVRLLWLAFVDLALTTALFCIAYVAGDLAAEFWAYLAGWEYAGVVLSDDASLGGCPISC